MREANTTEVEAVLLVQTESNQEESNKAEAVSLAQGEPNQEDAAKVDPVQEESAQPTDVVQPDDVSDTWKHALGSVHRSQYVLL